jgi:aspartyl-tRNA(Asn)/glutamyl-tRNA(Gln) amidotransferase subunit B
VPPAALAGLVKRVLDGTISGKSAKDFAAMATASERTRSSGGPAPGADAGAIEAIVDEVLAGTQAGGGLPGR